MSLEKMIQVSNLAKVQIALEEAQNGDYSSILRILKNADKLESGYRITKFNPEHPEYSNLKIAINKDKVLQLSYINDEDEPIIGYEVKVNDDFLRELEK